MKFFPDLSVIPFIVMLLSMAILPMAIPKWWESNWNKLVVSAIASIPVLIMVFGYHCQPRLLGHTMLDYISFIILLGALFIISGGIHIRGAWTGTPLVNTLFLGVGAVLANLIGTTGASMLLIRPFMRANHKRKRRTHQIIFFIFVVSNMGGLLTPLGDPPLFLGFLRGVPFQWTLGLYRQWVFAIGVTLIVFNFIDQYIFHKEDIETPGDLDKEVQSHRRLHIDGGMNFIFLLGVMAAVFFSGQFKWPKGIQELIMVAMALLSWFRTPREIHKANHFHFHPIAEVAALFLGIFVTMIPALEILARKASGWSFLQHPWQFFWIAGGLSSFLDNAPTYLTFVALASGAIGGNFENLSALVNHDKGALLQAISCGAVFMGANTYIGNGPNLMVRSIAEHAGIKMPSFFGYMLYSISILIPLFIAITLIFF
jgi:Na+/H+ antiporter NhaD/arsenite permease-like protein